MKIVLTLAVLLGLNIYPYANPVTGTWREGFRDAYVTWQPHQFIWCLDTFNPLRLLRPRLSTDLGGNVHLYFDNRWAGYVDGREALYDEWYFIALHNVGDESDFIRIMHSFIGEQNLEEIIPPGHF